MSKTILLLLLSFSFGTIAQKKAKSKAPVQSDNSDKKTIIHNINQRFNEYAALSKQIWNLAELGYQEVQSAAILQELLKKEGFVIEAGVAGIPTAFVATYGSGAPTIGILGEYDALPGISQEAIPELSPIPSQKAGHACGHNLFGTASAAAAIEVKNWL